MEQSKNKLIAGIVVIAAVALIAFAASSFSKKDEEMSSASEPATSQAAVSTDDSATQTASDVPASATSESYRDGTYTVEDSYSSPGGTEGITVTVAVSGGKVSSATVSQEANNRESEEYQSRFKSGFSSKVVGKALNDLQLSRVSGASLTTDAFNDALDQIRTKAKA